MQGAKLRRAIYAVRGEVATTRAELSKNDQVNYDLDTLRGDLFGGSTSTVVALPVALAFGVASGLGAAAGLYGAFAVGFFAAVFGGTRSQISGPTAPMAVIITSHASNLTEALTVVVLGRLLQVLLGVLRIGRFVAYTPHVVVSGFMSGIGIIVMLIPTLPFLGAPTATGGPLGALRALPEAVDNINLSALAVAVVTLATGVLWPRRLARYLPRALVALIAGTLLGVLWLRDVPVIGGGAHRPAAVASAAAVRGVPAAGRAAGGQTRVSGALRAVFVLALLLGLGRYVEPIPHAVLAGILMKVGWDIIDWRMLTRIHRIRRAVVDTLEEARQGARRILRSRRAS